jgi:hypothetical protein
MSTIQASTASDSASDCSYEDDKESTTGTLQSNGMETTQEDQVKEVEEMAKSETKNMRVWKCVVTLTVLITAVLVSTGTCLFLQGDEDSNFEDSYYSFANTIGDAAKVHSRNLFSTMRSLSSTISSAATTTNSEFPFVTVPAFEVLAGAARQQSGAELLIFTPKVEVNEVPPWNEYAIANQGWYEESKQLAVSSGENTSVLSDFAPGGPIPFLYDAVVDENGNPFPGPPRNPSSIRSGSFRRLPSLLSPLKLTSA